MEASENPIDPPAPKRENIWLNMGLNVLVPSLILAKGEEYLPLDATQLLILALAFPLLYGIYDGFARKKVNFFSILGFVSVLITGGIGLLDLDVKWIAVKEAAIPAAFGVAVLVSLKTKYPLVRMFLYNPELFDVPKIDRALDERNAHPKFEGLMRTCTYWLVLSFALSAVLNYGLAKYCFAAMATMDPVADKPAYDTAFNAANARMMWMSYIVITIPTLAVTMLAIVKLLKGIREHTGYEMEDVLRNAPPKKDEEVDEEELPEGSEADVEIRPEDR